MSLRIERIELREIAMPLRAPFAISSGVFHHRRIILVRVLDAEGATGWGECVAGEQPNYSPETVDGAWQAIEQWVAPRVLGVAFESAGEVIEALDAEIRGNRMAKAAVEMAAWDLDARRRDVSLAHRLGGTRETIEVGISLGLEGTPDALVERALAAREDGYRRIKLKVAPGRDVPFVTAVRQALGEEAVLSVDANAAYTEDDLDVMRALDDLGLAMIEQPLAWDDLVRHARLQEKLETPLCLDESITSSDRARDMIDLGAGRIVNIKPGRVGGLGESRRIHDICSAAGVPVWCGGMLEAGIGRAANVALASLPGFTLPGDLSPSSRYWEQDIVEPAWTMSGDGMVTVPLDRPGLGVAVDAERIDALTVRENTLL